MNTCVSSGFTKKNISFREEFKVKTTSSVFGLYRYPAKFIPNVVFYILENYVNRKEVVFDPFAGFGTVGFCARMYHNPYILWDLNPMLEIIHSCILTDIPDVKKVISFLKKEESSEVFIPNWSNIRYWFPEKFIEFLGGIWFKVNSTSNPIIKLALLKTTRYFSYSDDKIYKLYKSKKGLEKINKILTSEWRNLFFEKLENELINLSERVLEYKRISNFSEYFEVKFGVDSIKEELDVEVDHIITSPPYIQAQEYIRSTKLELFWLGYNEEYIRRLSSMEIPYRKDVPDFSINSEKYETIKNLLDGNVKNIYERYFKSILYTFQKLSNNVKKYMFIFVGDVYAGEIKVPIDEIIVEHFLNSNRWTHKITYIDKIKGRQIFSTKNNINPASGKINKRTESEKLIILRRRNS